MVLCVCLHELAMYVYFMYHDATEINNKYTDQSGSNSLSDESQFGNK